MFAVQTVIGDSAMTGLGNLTTYITRASVIKTREQCSRFDGLRYTASRAAKQDTLKKLLAAIAVSLAGKSRSINNNGIA